MISNSYSLSRLFQKSPVEAALQHQRPLEMLILKSKWKAQALPLANVILKMAKAPLVTRDKSTHDKVTKTIIHENVRMHILGLPVFYMPVLAHPDGTVKRRTGFLAPTVQYSSAQGFNTSIPYYKTLGPSADVEFRPHLFQHRGQALETIYRQKTNDADVAVIHIDMATFKDRENVAAIDATYDTEIGDDWQVSAQLQRSSQDTFLRLVMASVQAMI